MLVYTFKANDKTMIKSLPVASISLFLFERRLPQFRFGPPILEVYRLEAEVYVKIDQQGHKSVSSKLHLRHEYGFRSISR